MNVTAEQLINFVATEGDKFDVSIEDIEVVGLDNVLHGISTQADPRLSALGQPVAETDTHQCMADFFAESFGRLYDQAYNGWL